jgi:hypothetical protein
MNIKILILATLLATSGCNSRTSINYADNLKGCLTDEDIMLLNEACLSFELKLINKYKVQKLGQAYKKFLQDVQKMALPPGFFVTTDSNELLERIRKSKTFDKIWTKLSSVESYEDIEIITTDGSQIIPQDEFDSYCTNPRGNYIECLTKQNINNAIGKYLETIKSVPGLSPGITSGVLNENLTDTDFDNELTRLIIAIGFYYELVLLLERS